MSKKIYPIYLGKDCLQCGDPLIAKYGGMNKPSRTFCSRSCKTTHMNLTNNPAKKEEAKDKIRAYALANNKGKKRSPEFVKMNRIRNLGSKSHFWKGGKTPETRLIRGSLEYRNWRTQVFERDNYTCQFCGERSRSGHPVTLNADHIKPFADYPELRLELDNGRTLCLDCHKKTPSYLNRYYRNRASESV